MNRKRSDSGFTLIECLVALAIFAVSAATLFQIASSGLGRVSETRNREIARAHLQSMLDAAGPDANFRIGTSSGTFDDGFRWSLVVTPREGGDFHSPVSPVDVEASVSWMNGADFERRSLRTVRLVPSGGSP